MALDLKNVELQNFVNPSDSKALWVFGYGSLCWKPGFDFDKAITGHVKGYSRKFWQGNCTHRGTEQQPGRVATLIDDVDNSSVYGVAFAVSGENALPYLTQRECALGGYDTRFTTFYPLYGEPMKVILYIATPKNKLWLGDASPTHIANEITLATGASGHNVEYLLRLANFMRHHFPDAEDLHLFQLEEEVLKNAKTREICVTSLMGDGADCVTFTKSQVNPNLPRRERDDNERVDSFQFASRVPDKTLRCLNI